MNVDMSQTLLALAFQSLTCSESHSRSNNQREPVAQCFPTNKVRESYLRLLYISSNRLHIWWTLICPIFHAPGQCDPHGLQ